MPTCLFVPSVPQSPLFAGTSLVGTAILVAERSAGKERVPAKSGDWESRLLGFCREEGFR